MEETKVIHQIVKVQYYTDDGRLSDRAYTYFSEVPLKVGDIVTVPVRDTTAKAQVSAVDVPESEIAAFKDKVKTIPSSNELEFGANDLPPTAPTTAANANPEPTFIPDDSEAINVHIGTAVIKIQPESDITILTLLAEANRLRDYAIARVITTDADMSLAVNDLSIIAGIKKALTAKRAEYYKPIKAHLDTVSADFQTLLTPIEDADRITRDKWTAYRNEQARRKSEADAINRAKEELAKREAMLNHGEITVDLTPVEAPSPIVRVQTEMGTAGIVKNRKYRVVDFAKLPDQYKIENSALLNKVVKAGIPEIAGVEIYIEEGLRVSSTSTRERDFSRPRTPSPGMP